MGDTTFKRMEAVNVMFAQSIDRTINPIRLDATRTD